MMILDSIIKTKEEYGFTLKRTFSFAYIVFLMFFFFMVGFIAQIEFNENTKWIYDVLGIFDNVKSLVKKENANIMFYFINFLIVYIGFDNFE